MANKLFNVKFTGKFSEGKNVQDIVNQLSLLFNIEAEKLHKRLSSNQPWIIKKNVKADVAKALKIKLEEIGVLCVVQPAHFSDPEISEAKISEKEEGSDDISNSPSRGEPEGKFSESSAVDASRKRENTDDTTKKGFHTSANSLNKLIQTVPHIKKVVFSFIVVLILGLILIQPLRSLTFENSLFRNTDTEAIEFLDNSLIRASAAYGIARLTNGIISVIQEIEIGISIPVAANIAPFQFLDPINDLVERFSWVMLVSMISIGIQRLLVTVVPWLCIDFILLPGLVLLLAGIWTRDRFSLDLESLGKRLILFALVLRFAIPAEVLINDYIYKKHLDTKYNQSIAIIQRDIAEIQEKSPQNEIIRKFKDIQPDQNEDILEQTKTSGDDVKVEGTRTADGDFVSSITKKAKNSGWYKSVTNLFDDKEINEGQKVNPETIVSQKLDSEIDAEDNKKGLMEKFKDKLGTISKWGTFGIPGVVVSNWETIKPYITNFIPWLKKKVGSLTDKFIALIVIFAMNTILLPIFILWLIFQTFRILTDTKFGKKYEEKMFKKIFGKYSQKGATASDLSS